MNEGDPWTKITGLLEKGWSVSLYPQRCQTSGKYAATIKLNHELRGRSTQTEHQAEGATPEAAIRNALGENVDDVA